MIQFKTLRLNGFKSFADKTELDIGTGLNGIVGPNGCGKSNLVEAMRWIMGESSAKKMRGGGMEDVIFAGTSKRTAKNIAEVSLLLDNTARAAPPQFNGFDEIEIVRRIEKDHGSTYKINGKTVRARDVAMLFADTVTGSNSPALVSQGKITQIINAKPLERRMVLEESAGISGLFARRHEAELRLKAADANLVRLEDVLGGVETQLASLKRQARQASKYKNLSAQIRQLDALIAYLEWKALNDRKIEVQRLFTEAEKSVAERMITVTQLTKTQTTQAENLPALRKQEAEAASALQHKKIILQRLEDEIAQIITQQQETKAQLEQTLNDLHHEEISAAETKQFLAQIDSEEKQLLEEQKGDDKHLQEKEAAKEELEKRVAQLEERYTALMQSEAERNAKSAALHSRLEQNQQRLSTLNARLETTQERLRAQESHAGGDIEAAQTLEKSIQALEKALQKNNAALEESHNTLTGSKEQIAPLRKDVQDIETQISELKTEIHMIESFLDSGEQSEKILIDQITANPGFETALSRALGDSLMASLEENASAYWVERRSAPAFPALPSSVKPLEPNIKAPAILKAALSQIGYVADYESGAKALHELQAGQSIVSKDGHYWRWDGYCIKADAKDRNAQHLEYKNRLSAAQKDLPKLEKALEAARKKQSTLDSDVQALEQKIATLRQEIHNDGKLLTEQNKALSNIKEKTARESAERESLQAVLQTLEADKAALDSELTKDKAEIERFEQDNQNKQIESKEDLHKALSEAREAHREAMRIFDRHIQQQSTRKARLQAIADDRINLKNRNIRANERLKTLSQRKEDLEQKQKAIANQPQDFDSRKDGLMSEIAVLERSRNDAAERLQICENEVLETSKALKTAENILGEEREKRAHAQATLSSLMEQIENVSGRIEEKFSMEPRALLQEISVSEEELDTAKLDSFKSEREKLVIERETLGAVNLRAEEEALEIEREAGKLIYERNDLVQAIEELRGGIQKINKEARARLLVAFDHVNAHFQSLFQRLFQGGQAHLSLIDSEDPLGAGLEIFAQPPGKSLQSLSLLSGGEQTLTAIALIFAMFLTNPSPICVLDEIDAPLDDSNVDRLCDMLDEIAERGETRFLIVTHHRLTMARMDRLYGVTMAERGVSQLVSVDLQQSFSFLDEAA
ncbi:MAG: chromosome segregation protein SMC [Alphaproteobacteria bacterium]